MKSTSYAPRSRAWIRTAILLAALVALPVEAGEKLTVAELVAETQGAVVVRVHLATKISPDRIEFVRPLEVSSPNVQPDVSWPNLCVPRRRMLTRWIIQYAKWPARSLWRRALSRGSYEAVVMLQKDESGLSPYCGLEAMQMRHTDLHRDYTQYQTEVARLIAKRGRTGL